MQAKYINGLFFAYDQLFIISSHRSINTGSLNNLISSDYLLNCLCESDKNNTITICYYFRMHHLYEEQAVRLENPAI